jgi:hypothetical protein
VLTVIQFYPSPINLFAYALIDRKGVQRRLANGKNFDFGLQYILSRSYERNGGQTSRQTERN